MSWKHALLRTGDLMAKPPASGGPTFFFGGRRWPIQAANKHIVFVAATGGGKTVSFRLLMQDILPQIGRHEDEGGWRAVVYDAKEDLLGQLRGIGLDVPIIVGNMFDQRSSAWAIAQDTTSPSAAQEVATILIPQEPHSAQPFFSDAARDLLYGTLIAFHQIAPGAWTLRHAALVMRSEELLRQHLGRCRETRHLARLYLKEDGKMLLSIMATIASKMRPYEIVAALWDQAEQEGRTFSLREFVEQERILVLGCHEEDRSAVDAMNRVLFARLAELLIGQRESKTRRTFVFLDEVREAGQLDKLGSVALRGRSKGVACVLGLQSKAGLNFIWGEEVADEIIGQCGFKGIFKLDGADAEWAARQFGAEEVVERRPSTSTSFSSQDTTISQGTVEDIRERDVVLANEIMYLPLASARHGLVGYYKTPYGAFRSCYDFVPLLVPADTSQPDFCPRPEEHQYLEDWRTGELERFGLVLPPEWENDGAAHRRGGHVPGSGHPRDRRRRQESKEQESAEGED